MDTIRKCFTSRFPGGHLVEMDLEQIEIVCQAFLTGSVKMKEYLEKGIDFHCMRLAEITHVDYSDIVQYIEVERDKAWITLRKEIKAVTFQYTYGASALSISKSTGMPKKEVENILDVEDRLFPEINKWRAGMLETVREKRKYEGKFIEVGGYTLPVGTSEYTSLTGRSYAFVEESCPWNKIEVSFSRNKVINYPIQGLAGEIIRVILGTLFRKLLSRRERILFVNTIHDSIKWDCLDLDSAMELKEAIEEVMKEIDKLLAEKLNIDWDLPVRYSLTFGKNWQLMIPFVY